jgi:DNA cross-link repair 1C protein
MQLFPPTTYFFINAWTWGYEDILKAVARAFGSKVSFRVQFAEILFPLISFCQIHVDEYKHTVYSHVNDPFLRAIVTLDSCATRIHACERFDRCEEVPHESSPEKSIVYVNPVTMSITAWSEYRSETRKRIGRGELVTNLVSVNSLRSVAISPTALYLSSVPFLVTVHYQS